jgi:monoamine oxidase
MEELAKPIENKVYFAGEATNYEFLGCTHTAYLSGVRAAKEIID